MDESIKNNDRTLNSGKIEYGSKASVVFFNYIHLDNDISPIAGKTMKSGYWILLNTLPWYFGSGQNMKRNFKSLPIPDSELILSLPTSTAKSSSLSLINAPARTKSLSFIHFLSFKSILNTAQLSKYIDNNIEEKYKQVFRQALLVFSCKFKTSTLVSHASKHASGRKQKHVDSLLDPVYQKKRKLEDAFCEVMGAAKSTQSFARSLVHLADQDELTAGLVADVVKASPAVSRLIVEDISRGLAKVLPTPPEEALYLKDAQSVSDAAWSFGTSTTRITDNLLNPRKEEMMRLRVELDRVVMNRFLIKSYESNTAANGLDVQHAVADLTRICEHQVLHVLYGAWGVVCGVCVCVCVCALAMFFLTPTHKHPHTPHTHSGICITRCGCITT